MTDQNGQTARVQFERGRADKTIGADVAAEMLQAWRERNPAQFGYWLAAALVGAEPRKTARDASSASEAGSDE